MNKFKVIKKYLFYLLILSVYLIAGCGGGTGHWEPGSDGTAPTVISTVPANAATGVARDTTISATFSKTMDSSTITTTTFTIQRGTKAVSGTVAYSGVTAVFTPGIKLAAGATYTGTITTGAKDVYGNPLASNYVWNFTTAAATDTTAPTVISTIPADTETDVATNTKVYADFSKEMDSSTITKTSFTLKQGATSISGTVTYSGITAVFKPDVALSNGTTYTATITTDALDLAGNPLANDYVWSFTTIAAAGLGPEPVDLGTAKNYATLTKAGITTVPGTIDTSIVGDIGVSPAAATSMTGFGLVMDSTGTFSKSALVTGKVYAANYTAPTPARMTTAVSDMETAYNDAAGRPAGVGVYLNPGVGGDLAGLNLTAGTYTFTGASSNVTITNDLTLTGGANDVWIFQIPGTLGISNAKKVTLAGGAQAKNIFWQVAGAVTFITDSEFKGIILAKTSIAMQDGAKLQGRPLAQTAVTLIGNTLTLP
jgi:hypothetical protein